MQRYVNYLAGTTGQPVQGASVTVLTYPGAIPATIFSDNGVTPAPNPLTTDASGGFSFYAADGHYALSFTGSGITPTTINDVILADVLPGDLAVASSIGATDAVRVDQGGVMKTATPGLVNTIANGGTGASTQANALANILGSSQIPVANGGTGRATLTNHGVLVGATAAAISQTAVGTTGQALIGQTGADPVFGFPTGALIGVQVFSASGTYTNTAGTNSVIVEAIGGGGGSGGCAATAAGAGAGTGGGGGGAFAKARLTSGFTGGITITIGAAGAAGTAGANTGGAGGTTSFGAVISVPGGGSSSGAASGTTAIFQGGGLGGAAPTISSGTTLVSSAGQAGTFSALAAAGAWTTGGTGAGSPIGGGGNGGSVGGVGAMVGVAASGGGAGGGGSASGPSSSAITGAAGSKGIVIVYEYA